MKAMILAAGLGSRMRPLTNNLPKPLLKVKGQPLIVWLIKSLKQAGINEFVINLAYLGDKISHYLGDGRLFGVSIVYSQEPEPLETAGGIIFALPLLGKEPFIVVNGDIFTNFDFRQLTAGDLTAPSLAKVILVKNPQHHPNGDFSINQNGLMTKKQQNTFTFAGIGLYHPDFFHLAPPKGPLRYFLLAGIEREVIEAVIFEGLWSDIGTPERFNVINQIK